MSRLLQYVLQNLAQRSAFGLRPWCTWSARRLKPCLDCRALRTCKRTTESTPPDNPTATSFFLRETSPRKSPTAAVRSPLGGFFELAIAHDPLEPLLDQLARLLVF